MPATASACLRLPICLCRRVWRAPVLQKRIPSGFGDVRVDGVCPIWSRSTTHRQPLPVPSACSSRRSISASRLAGLQACSCAAPQRAMIDESAGHTCTSGQRAAAHVTPWRSRPPMIGRGSPGKVKRCARWFRPDREPNLHQRMPRLLRASVGSRPRQGTKSRLSLSLAVAQGDDEST